MKNKWYQSPIVIVFMCLLVFPVGLLLLGSSQQVRWLTKSLVSLTFILVIIIFFIYYEPIPRRKSVTNIPATTETIEYKIKKYYSKNETINGILETVKPVENEFFFFVEFDVTNNGEKTVFYISLVDDPKVVSNTNTFYPDLTLSQEPFGDLKPKQTLSGFLVFRIPVGENLLKFKVSNLTKDINFSIP